MIYVSGNRCGETRPTDVEKGPVVEAHVIIHAVERQVVSILNRTPIVL